MSDPQDHSRSGSERGEAAGDPGPGAGDEALRFWGEYARRPRPGVHREQRESAREAANGHGSAAAGHGHECLEWCPICRTADVLRASAPPELRDQVQSLQRDALVTFRALIDAYIDRLENGSRRRESAVEDIPIE